MKTTEKNKNPNGGRPSKLTDEKIILAIKLRERGFSILEISSALGVSEQLFYIKNSDWGKLRDRLNLIKAKQDLERISKVEKSLYNRAIGYKAKEKRENFDAEGNLTGSVITTKHIPADVKAQQFYLINRAFEDWKERPAESENTENNDTQLKIEIIDKIED